MNTKNIVLSLTIAGIITSSALMPMKRTWDDNDPTMQDHHLSKKTKTSDVVTMSDFFDSLPNETNDHIGQFLVPAHLDLTNPTHIKIIRTIVRYKNINRHFHHTIVPLCLRHIRAITLSDAIITNQQKFNRFLAFLSQLINLNAINLQGTNITDQQLSALLDVVNRNKIKQLKLSFCSNLQNPTFTNLPALTSLYLPFCDNLQNPTLTNLPALTKLDLSFCNDLQNPTLSNLPALTSLKLSFCHNLQNPILNNLPALTKLDLSGLAITDTLLSNILDHGNFRNSLKALYLSFCHNLQNPTLNNLPALTKLDLSGLAITDTLLSNILDHGNFKNSLKALDLSYCHNLQNPTLNNLPALTKLDLSATNITDTLLSNILDHGNFRNSLKALKLSSCHNLQSPTLNNLPALISLNLSSCFHLQNPIFNNLPALTKLYLFHCPNLALVTLSTTMQHLHLEQQHSPIHFNYVNNQ